MFAYALRKPPVASHVPPGFLESQDLSDLCNKRRVWKHNNNPHKFKAGYNLQSLQILRSSGLFPLLLQQLPPSRWSPLSQRLLQEHSSSSSNASPLQFIACMSIPYAGQADTDTMTFLHSAQIELLMPLFDTSLKAVRPC